MAASSEEKTVRIPVESVALEGNLVIPEVAQGVVVFAHGSGSSRHSPRNRYVAGVLQRAGLATLLMDLLTSGEEEEDRYSGKLRFDIRFLAERLVAAMTWLAAQEPTRKLPIGCFGASTGGGAALVAAAMRPDLVKAVVSRGGRPDLAAGWLERVQTPTLLLVGGEDTEVITLNEDALEWMRINEAEVRLMIIPGATHLFEEPGTLEEVARLAKEWFVRHLHPVTSNPTDG